MFDSEHVNTREPRLARDAIPKADCETDVAGPQGISSATNGDLRAAILDDCRHSELACTVEPNGIVRSAVELEERIAISAGAVAEVRALGKRSGGPGKATAVQQKCVECGRSERCIREGRHHAGRTVTVLAYKKPLLTLASRAPRCSNVVMPRFRFKRLRHKLSHVRLLRGRQPIPAAQQRDEVASEAVNGSQKRSLAP
jgi:hypothetical protein